MGLARNNWAIANFFDWFAFVSSALGLLGWLAALILFCINIGNHGQKRDQGSLCSDRDAMRYFATKRRGGCCGVPSFDVCLCRCWWPTADIPSVPTLAELFQAGDTLTYTSATLDGILPHHVKVCWIPFYCAVLNEVVRSPEKQEAALKRSSYLRKALDLASASVAQREPNRNDLESFPMASTNSGIGPERHALYDRRSSGDPLLVSCIRQLDNYNPAGEDTLPQASRGLGLDRPHARQVWVFNRQPCIEISQVELAELSLFFGMKLFIKAGGTTSRIYGVGAFGAFLTGYVENGVWRINLAHCHRHRREVAVKGSGYSTLHAKYVACGCLPFGQREGWILYVHLNSEVDKAVRDGSSIKDGDEIASGEELEAKKYLKELSTIGAFMCFNRGGIKDENYYGMFLNREGDKLYHKQKALGKPEKIKLQENKEGKQSLEMPVPKEESQNLGSWSRAVAYIAFGGLVPQAADALAAAIRFTALGDLKLQQDGESTEQKLEIIINKIHRKHPADNLFGWFVSYRTQQERQDALFVPTHPSTWNVRRAAATFARYMTLIEYLVAHFDTNLLKLDPDEHKTWQDANDTSSGRREVAFKRLHTRLQEAHKKAVREKAHENATKASDGSDARAQCEHPV